MNFGSADQLGVQAGRGCERLDREFTIHGSGEDAIWTVRPGSDVWLVWTPTWQNELETLRSREFVTPSRGAAMKVNHSYRF